MVICAVDPGVTTGYALAHLTDDGNITIIEKGDVRGIPGARYLAALPASVWVIERFRLIPHMAKQVAINDPDLVTARVIGALEAMVLSDQLLWQQPSDKNGVPDSELHSLHLWANDDSRHVRDALRHVIAYTNRRAKHARSLRNTQA